MRATLGQDGTLTITPDSELEAYALSAWSAARTKRGGGRSALVVKTAYETQTLYGTISVGSTGTYSTPPFSLTGGACVALNECGG